MKTPILERIECWYTYAHTIGLKLDRILIHPNDAAAAPASYKGLPVIFIGRKP